MSAFKGTPGPWQLSSESPTIIKQDMSLIGLPDGGVLIGSACGHESSGFYPTVDEAEANARLIAAAPDSHEANVKFIEAIECFYNVTAGWTDDCIYDELPSSGLALAYFAARAAIAKATGGDA